LIDFVVDLLVDGKTERNTAKWKRGQINHKFGFVPRSPSKNWWGLLGGVGEGRIWVARAFFSANSGDIVLYQG
jgi:hypothetical protein